VLRTDPSRRIGELSREVGLSHDALEKRFRREVGCTPKHFASVTRLHAALRAHRPGQSLTQLALDAGYFDQPHFNRAFRALVGVAPGEYLRS
jgi:AraC-like DNA-binding protein